MSTQDLATAPASGDRHGVSTGGLTGVRDEIDPVKGKLAHFPESLPLKMDSGAVLAPFTIAYQTYGELNAARSNAVLICHALTGEQHVASRNPVTGKRGWWTTMVGPGRPIDTNRFSSSVRM